MLLARSWKGGPASAHNNKQAKGIQDSADCLLASIQGWLAGRGVQSVRPCGCACACCCCCCCHHYTHHTWKVSILGAVGRICYVTPAVTHWNLWPTCDLVWQTNAVCGHTYGTMCVSCVCHEELNRWPRVWQHDGMHWMAMHQFQMPDITMYSGGAALSCTCYSQFLTRTSTATALAIWKRSA
jgi:hypothetical protein